MAVGAMRLATHWRLIGPTRISHAEISDHYHISVPEDSLIYLQKSQNMAMRWGRHGLTTMMFFGPAGRMMMAAYGITEVIFEKMTSQTVRFAFIKPGERYAWASKVLMLIPMSWRTCMFGSVFGQVALQSAKVKTVQGP